MPTQRPTASPIQTADWTSPLPEPFFNLPKNLSEDFWEDFSKNFSKDFPNLSDQELSLWQQLEDEMHYLNQLAVEQEAALLQFLDMVEQLRADCPRSNLEADELLASQGFGELVQKRARGVLSVSRQLLEGVGGAIVLLGTAMIDRIHALRIKAAMGDTSATEQTAPFVRRSIGLRHSAASSPDRPSAPNLPQEDPESAQIEILPTLQEILMLTLGSAISRAVLDRIVQFYPALWFIAVLLMVIPAAIAIYQTHRSPRSGFLWGCRLTLILVGLLLGKRM